MAHADFKDLPRGTSSGYIILNKTFDFAQNLKYDGYQRGLVWMVYQFFYQTSRGTSFHTGIWINSEDQ